MLKGRILVLELNDRKSHVDCINSGFRKPTEKAFRSVMTTLEKQVVTFCLCETALSTDSLLVKREEINWEDLGQTWGAWKRARSATGGALYFQ